MLQRVPQGCVGIYEGCMPGCLLVYMSESGREGTYSDFDCIFMADQADL
jgi:hypothetical protein